MLTAHRATTSSRPGNAGAPVAVSRLERLRWRRRRFREVMVVVTILTALLFATVVILGRQWLDNPGSSAALPSPSAHAIAVSGVEVALAGENL